MIYKKKIVLPKYPLFLNLPSVPFFTQFQMKMKINMTEIIPPFLVFIVLQFTGLPTKDENSESTLRNLYRLFPFIHES